MTLMKWSSIKSQNQDRQEKDDDDDDDDEINNEFNEDSFHQQREVKQLVESLLNVATDNANENVFNNNKKQNQQRQQQQQQQQMVPTLFQLTTQRAYSTTQMKSKMANEGKEKDGDEQQQQQQRQQELLLPHYTFPFATRYKYHPAISNVALAQALWSTVIRPNVDTVIDATCGNGYDSVAIAKLLFQKNSDENKCYAQLICLDIQKEACENTRQLLKQTLEQDNDTITTCTDYYNDHVDVLHASHEVLPRPKNDTSVGLVVYNLGWLPNHTEKDCITTMETTVLSITDALLMIRIGGMLSVVTYPKTGPDEDCAVRLFVTCLALLSSNVRSWQDAIVDETNKGTDPKIIKHVEQAMGRVVQYSPGTTWRVSKHDKIGMEQAPILYTATRIK